MNPRLAVPTFLAALLAGLLWTLPSAAQEEATAEPSISAGYRQLVRSLLEATGVGAAGEQIAYSMANETLGAISAAGTPLTEEIQQIVLEEALAEFVPRFGDLEYLTDLYAPLYVKHFDEGELKKIVEFHRSEVGQKMLATIPEIASAALVALQEASLAMIPEFQLKVDKRLRDAGIVVAP